jgi:uncharacterized protein (TIRG00374 family)
VSLLVFGLLILAAFIFTLDPKEIVYIISSLSSPAKTIIATVGVTLISILFKSYRWRLLIFKITNTKTSLWFSFQAVLAGIAAGSFIPGRIELARPLVYNQRHNIPITKSLSALIIERALDLLCFVLFLLVGLLLIPSQKIISLNIVIIILSLISFCILSAIIFPKQILNIIKKITNYIPLPLKFKEKTIAFIEQSIMSFTIFHSKKTILNIAFLSFITNILEFVRVYILLSAFEISVSIPIILTILSAGILLGVLSAIPGGIGVTEFSSASILTTLAPNILPAMAKSIILLDRVISYYIIIILGALCLIHLGYFTKIEPPSQPNQKDQLKEDLIKDTTSEKS